MEHFLSYSDNTDNYSKKINHGEAVLMGMMMATKLSYELSITSKKTIDTLRNTNKEITRMMALSKKTQ